MSTVRTTRFSGAEWAEELKPIDLIGAGGIGSWLALNLSRIGHSLTIWDGDSVDITNVSGGQLFKHTDVGETKVAAIMRTCREFGCIAPIDAMEQFFEEDWEGKPVNAIDQFPMTSAIVITGLDNMKARKEVFNEWNRFHSQSPDSLFMDGRLLMENMEIFTIKGGDKAAILDYQTNWLFDDSEVPDGSCTTKQSTFSAMIIAGLMTATLCNFLTNNKLGVEMRDIPFHQKLHLPMFRHECIAAEVGIEIHAELPRGEEKPVTIPEIIGEPEDPEPESH